MASTYVPTHRPPHRRFAPNVAEVADEFNQLAKCFAESFLPQYAALSWLGAAQCHKAMGNSSAEVDYLLKSADASIAADRYLEQLHTLSNDRSHLENALRCYNQALDAYADESVFRAAIIRKIKRIQPHCELTSSFASPSHRMHDLDRAADACVRSGDYAAALEKRTEIFDDICERRVQSLYTDLLRGNEIARVLLLLWLELPPARQSPSHVALLRQFTGTGDEQQPSAEQLEPQLPADMRWALAELVRASLGNEATAMAASEAIPLAVNRMLRFHSLTPQHRRILRRLHTKATEIR